MPTALSYVPKDSASTALQSIGTGMSAFGALQAGSVNSYIAARQALIASQQAVSAVQKGASDEALYRTRARQFEGKQEAAIGASGIQRTGSALRVLEDTAGLAAADIARIRNNAANDAWGFRTNQAAEGFNSSTARSRGVGEAVGTLLSGSSRNRGIWDAQ